MPQSLEDWVASVLQVAFLAIILLCFGGAVLYYLPGKTRLAQRLMRTGGAIAVGTFWLAPIVAAALEMISWSTAILYVFIFVAIYIAIRRATRRDRR